MKNFPLLLAVAWLLCLVGQACAADPLPPKPIQYVTDNAGILSAATRRQLNDKLAAYERATSNQVLVATFPAVPDDYQMEDFTQRTFDAWGVGQKEKNNGVVLFIFPNSHKMRIEVGYGLEGAIPDATAKSIIINEITPAFRAGNFDRGVTQGVDAILAAAQGEYQGTGRTDAEDHTVAVGTTMGGIFLFFILLTVVFGHLVRQSQSYTYDKHGRRRNTHGWRTWLAIAAANNSSYSSSGGSWSSSSGGGGFSGGGGSSGGGGASGSW